MCACSFLHYLLVHMRKNYHNLKFLLKKSEERFGAENQKAKKVSIQGQRELFYTCIPQLGACVRKRFCSMLSVQSQSIYILQYEHVYTTSSIKDKLRMEKMSTS